MNTSEGQTQEPVGGMRWVKASDRLPTKEGRYVVKRLRELLIVDAVLRENDAMVFATPNNMTWNGYKDFKIELNIIARFLNKAVSLCNFILRIYYSQVLNKPSNKLPEFFQRHTMFIYIA